MSEMPKFADWLKTLSTSSKHPFVRDSEKMIQYFFELEKKLPPRYGWRVTSVEAFQKQLSRITGKASSAKIDYEVVNRLYWHDMARNLEAYGLMTYWRSAELLRSAIKLLNEKEILAPAIISRSLLELGAIIIKNSNVIHRTLKDALTLRKGVITSNELEELVVRLIWGSKVVSQAVKPINSKEYRDFVSKNPNASELPEVYKFLCDLTHPNALGNARFWGSSVINNKDGSKTVTIQRDAESALTKEIREKILWALGWSAVCIRNGFEINQNTVQIILKRWPL
jgi:hypothetical protein